MAQLEARTGVDNKMMWQAYGYAAGGQIASMDSQSPTQTSASGARPIYTARRAGNPDSD